LAFHFAEPWVQYGHLELADKTMDSKADLRRQRQREEAGDRDPRAPNRMPGPNAQGGPR